MKKGLICVFLLLFSITRLAAQQITRAEYFFNTDPGQGLATPLPMTSGDSVIIINNISLPANLPAGINLLFVRTADNNGVWSFPEVSTIWVSTAPKQINSFEYFFDTDPGIGQATRISFPMSDSIDLVQNLVVPDTLTPGMHFLFVRVQNQGGTWSFFEMDTVTVTNATIDCPGNAAVNAAAGQCSAVVNNIDPTISPARSFTYNFSGATTGAGNGTASGQSFNAGVTTVTYSLPGSQGLTCSFTVTVTASVVPSVSIGASASTIDPGTNVTFTATPVNGGSSPSYQWKVNGNNAGINSATYQNASLANNDIVTVVMTSSLSCANPVTAISNPITITVTSTITGSQYNGGNGDGHSGVIVSNQNQLFNFYKGGNNDGFQQFRVSGENALPALYHGGANDGFAMNVTNALNPLPLIYNGGTNDGFHLNAVVSQNQLANIYFGGNNDGFNLFMAPGQLPLVNIYSGGNNDGFHLSNTTGQNTFFSIYKGGINDGFHLNAVVGQNHLANIYSGGNNDGFNLFLTPGQNPLMNIYSGGNNDGFHLSNITGQNSLSSIYKGGINDGWATLIISNQNPLEFDGPPLRIIAAPDTNQYRAPAVKTPSFTIPEKVKETTYLLYPNPGTGRFTLMIQGEDDLTGYHYRIYSQAGSLIRFDKIEDSHTAFDISNLSSGTYFLQIIKNNKPGTTIKIILIK